MFGNLGKLIVSLAACQLAGIVGGLFTASSIGSWYAGLNKPSFNPPNWVFGPVWITLYVLMGIALYLVWAGDFPGKAKQTAVILFFIQLVLNMFWTFFFFYLQKPFLGLIEIVILLVFIILTMWKFYTLRPAAAYLMMPYLLWVGFAAVLTFSLWNLNR
jgi:tryptophan-rich sensory protein